MPTTPSMPHTDQDARHRLTAAYYRGALSVGLAQPAHVVHWADTVIDQHATVPDVFYDLSLGGDRSRWHLYSLLEAVARGPLDESDSLRVARALLDTAWQDLRAGRRTTHQTVEMLRQMQALPLPDALRYQLVGLEENYSLAADGIYGKLSVMEREVHYYLSCFDGAAAELLEAAA